MTPSPRFKSCPRYQDKGRGLDEFRALLSSSEQTNHRTTDTFSNQRDEVVGTHSFTLFRYKPAGGDA